MALDIRGSLKNTKINANQYVVFEELLSNAIDAYLIRKNTEASLKSLKVDFRVEFFNRTLDASQVDFKIVCTDNGGGFGEEQIKAFVTKDTSYKDDLAIVGIGKCRGSGRIQFMHYFSNIKIDSTSQTGAKELRRVLLTIDPSVKEVTEGSFVAGTDSKSEVGTSISLEGIKTDVYDRHFKNRKIRDEFSAPALKYHILVTFLQRFVSLRERLGAFSIKFTTVYGQSVDTTELVPADLPQPLKSETVDVWATDEKGSPIGDPHKIAITQYKVSASQYKLRCNYVALCARSSTVKLITNRYLKSKALINGNIKGFYHIILIESPFLDEKANERRDDFDILHDADHGDLYRDSEITWENLFEKIDPLVEIMITPPDWSRDKLVQNVAQKFGISSTMISNADVRVHFGDTEEKVVKRVLDSYQQQIIKDTSEIFDIKQKITEVDPTSPEFREKVNEFAWKYSSSVKYIDMANLSQIVVRRAFVVEVLSLAITKGLAVQTQEDGRRKDEKIIHSIFFPMGKDNAEVIDHDIWLLSEEYQYFDYIASDKRLASYKWDGHDLLFDADIDEALEAVFSKKTEENGAKRPDIAIFSKEGAAVIVEFKSPDESLDEHVPDLMEYAQLLAAKSNGRLTKFYGYLIGSKLNANRLMGVVKSSCSNSYFATSDIREHQTNKLIGQIYYEILFYEDIVKRATKRLDTYKERLNLDFKLKRS